MKINTDNLYNTLLNWGTILLAVSITMSITLMNIAFGILFLAFLIAVFKRKIRFIHTGIEIPLAVFLLFYITSSLFSAHSLSSLKSVSDNYWYILHLYLVVYLFEEREIQVFTKTLGIAAFIMAVYSLLQSFAGFTMLGSLDIAGIKMGSRSLERITSVFGLPVYMGTGILGSHLTFGGQMLMLSLISFAAFRKKWPAIVIIMGLLVSFAYSSWFGFIAAVSAFYFIKKKRFFRAAAVISSFIILLFIIPGTRNIVTTKLADRIEIWKAALSMYAEHPLLGVGSGEFTSIFETKYSKNFTGSTLGARSHPHSIYLSMLTGGGLFTFLAFLFLAARFVKLYLHPLPSYSAASLKLHICCWLALGAVFAAGIFQTYLSDAENSVLIWTLAGLIIRIRTTYISRMKPSEI
ncbi:MAG: O-antigen ligase family protein [Elusimicrobiota bacterium]